MVWEFPERVVGLGSRGEQTHGKEADTWVCPYRWGDSRVRRDGLVSLADLPKDLLRNFHAVDRIGNRAAVRLLAADRCEVVAHVFVVA